MEYPIRVLQYMRVLDSGGIEAFVFANLRAIDRSKVVFDFLVTRDQEEFYDDEVKKLGGKKIVLKYKEFKNPILNSLSRSIAFYKFCKKNNDQYKVIHFQSIGSNGFFDIMAAKCAKIPYRIAHSHISNDIKPRHNSKKEAVGLIRKNIVLFRQNVIRKFVSKYSTHYFGCSKMACEWMFTKKINDEKKCIVVKNPIDVKKFQFNNDIRTKIRKELNIEDKYVIGHVGRFVYSKNHEFLLETFVKIKKECENAILVLVGGGRLKDEIMTKIKQLNIEESVILYGETDEVNNMYNCFDLFMFPSIYEGLGIVLVEAQANGLPVMASSSIPNEVKLTPNFNFCDIKDSENWVNFYNENKSKLMRKNENYDVVLKSGYDISDVSSFLQETYIRLNQI